MSSPHCYNEARVCERIGVDRLTVKKIRETELREGEDFKKTGAGVLLSRDGLDTLLGALRLRGADVPLDDDFDEECIEWGANGAKNSGARLPQVLTVLKAYPLNSKRLLALTRAGEQVLVRVRDNKNFRPSMQLTAMPVEPGKYTLVGRCPRRAGKY